MNAATMLACILYLLGFNDYKCDISYMYMIIHDHMYFICTWAW